VVGDEDKVIVLLMLVLLLVFRFEFVELDDADDDENRFMISDTPLDTEPFDEQTRVEPELYGGLMLM
jgi:hypothetical protein